METKTKVVSRLNDNKRQIKKNLYLSDIYPIRNNVEETKKIE